MIYHGINAKLHAMSGALFKYDDYEAFCRMQTVENIGRSLREQADYKKSLAGLGQVNMNRASLESKITLSLYEDYTRIRQFLYEKPVQEYLAAVFMRYVLDFLKLLLCMVFDERDIPYSLPEINTMLGWERRVDVARLVAAKTVPAFIEQLKDTDIYTILADTYARQPTLFALERQIDLYYYLQLWKKQELLSNEEDRAVMTRIKGTEIDLCNILWVYRLRRYYNISGSRIYAYLIPINYKLKPVHINRMVECETIEALLDEIARSPYGAVFGDFAKPEQAYTRAIRRLYTVETRAHPNTIAPATGYIFEKEQEINNITTILEGVRYGLPPEEIMGYVCV